MAPTTRESSEPKPNDSRHRSEISARISKVQPAFCPGDTPSETQGTQEGDLERVFAINTRATFLLAKAAHPLLKASRGDIVATASISSEHPTAPLGAYSARKAALVILIRQMALEWGPDGIRCNCVSPGLTHTGITAKTYDDPAKRERRGLDIPLRRIGAADDIARAVHFLAGPAADFVTGVNLIVDGGMTQTLMVSPAAAVNTMINR